MTEAAAATEEAAVIEEAVVTESEGSCRCCDDLEKFWCEEYLKQGLGRRCSGFEKSVEATEDSEDKTGEVNYFKLVWEKDETAE